MQEAISNRHEDAKEKVMFPEIVVRGTKDKPYYEIKYYDVTDKQWHLGYGSYNLEYVMQWKEECLEVVEGSITNILFEKIKERLEENQEITFYFDGRPPKQVISYDTAIEIVNQIAEEYKHGHFGCNMNGQHEKCKDCGLRGECSHYNTEWFGGLEIPNMSENITSSDGWIPCSERLPENKDLCWLTNVWPDGTRHVTYDFYIKGGGWFDTVSDSVLAWMPINKPAPYKPKGWIEWE